MTRDGSADKQIDNKRHPWPRGMRRDGVNGVYRCRPQAYEDIRVSGRAVATIQTTAPLARVMNKTSTCLEEVVIFEKGRAAVCISRQEK